MVVATKPKSIPFLVCLIAVTAVMAAVFTGPSIKAETAQVAVDNAPASFAVLAERLEPAVVNISTTQIIPGAKAQGLPMPEFPPGTPFEQFFRDFFENQMQRGPQKVISLGSGFIIDPKGMIVTDNHVIAGAEQITVKLADGSEYPAQLVGSDEKTDVALLKIKPKAELPAVSFGDSNSAMVGDWVLAIGNPFGLGGTVTAGIVSARNRNINAGPYDDFIQTDASINKGNSGGPLFNLAGQVIGVNTAIYTPSGGSVGIGFAIPSNMVKGVVDQLMKYGEVRRGWLGVEIQAVTADIAESLGLPAAKGAMVAGVDLRGPAFSAGIKSGDVIVKFDGEDITVAHDLPRIVAETEIGKTVPVVVFRDGKERTFDVKIERLKEATQSAKAESQSNNMKGSNVVLGLALADLDATLRQQYEIPANVSGVLIVDVDPDSDAADKVTPGDVIVKIDQQPVSTTEQAIKRIQALTAKSKKPILLLISRGGQPLYVSIRAKTS